MSNAKTFGLVAKTVLKDNDIRIVVVSAGGKTEDCPKFTDALKLMCPAVYAYEFDGKRYDMGDKFGSMQAITEFALKNEEIGEAYRKYLKKLAETL